MGSRAVPPCVPDNGFCSARFSSRRNDLWRERLIDARVSPWQPTWDSQSTGSFPSVRRKRWLRKFSKPSISFEHGLSDLRRKSPVLHECTPDDGWTAGVASVRRAHWWHTCHLHSQFLGEPQKSRRNNKRRRFHKLSRKLRVFFYPASGDKCRFPTDSRWFIQKHNFIKQFLWQPTHKWLQIVVCAIRQNNSFLLRPRGNLSPMVQSLWLHPRWSVTHNGSSVASTLLKHRSVELRCCNGCRTQSGRTAARHDKEARRAWRRVINRAYLPCTSAVTTQRVCTGTNKP